MLQTDKDVIEEIKGEVNEFKTKHKEVIQYINRLVDKVKIEFSEKIDFSAKIDFEEQKRDISPHFPIQQKIIKSQDPNDSFNSFGNQES